MIPKKEDRLGENLWDTPVRSNVEIVDEFGYKAAKKHRFLHLLIDLSSSYVLLMASQIGLIIIGSYMELDAASVLPFLFEGYMILVTYLGLTFLFEMLTKGQSLGKLVTGFCAMHPTGEPFTAKDAFVRMLARMIPFEFMALFIRRDNLTLHDVLSTTEIRLKRVRRSPRKNDVILD